MTAHISRTRATLNTYGVDFGHFEIINVAEDLRRGQWVILRAGKQEIEVRITPAGLLRASRPRPAGKIRSTGFAA